MRELRISFDVLWVLLTVPADYVFNCSFLKCHDVQETHEAYASYVEV